MTKETAIRLFEKHHVRSLWNEEEEKWYFSTVDIIAVLTESKDPLAYWRKLKERLKKEGNETVTNSHGLKMMAADGKMRMTDVGDTELESKTGKSVVTGENFLPQKKENKKLK